MGGFLAVLSSEGPVDPRAVERVAAAMSYRGSPVRWSDGSACLIAFGTATIAVAEDLAVVVDARIDDGAELDREAGAPPATDAERILLLWRRYGSEALDRIVGDLAGAVFERRTKRLIAIRDPVGGRPCLLARSRGRVLAGSALAGLLADPALDASVDEAWVARYLVSVPDFATATGYRTVTRLEPGTIATSDGSAWRTARWFSWQPERFRASAPHAYAERFAELFTEAVRCRIEGYRTAGIMLSGGLDSSSIAVTARAVRPDASLVALSIPFTGKGNEQALQRMVAERVGARLRWASLEGRSPFGRGPRDSLEIFGAPPVPPNRFHADAVADAAAEEGVEVALDGIDGDGIVAGNWTYLADLFATGRWRSWAREAAAVRDLHGASRRSLLTRYTLEPLAPPWLRRRLAPRADVRELLDPAFVRRHGLHRPDVGPWRPWASFRANEMIAAGTRILPLVQEITDEVWARRGIQIAHPFLDRRLIAFCLGLPREQKVHLGRTKIVLREAMEGLLPAEVAERSDKAELSEPFFAGLSGSGWQEIREGLTLAMSNPYPWFQPKRVARLQDGPERNGLFDAFRVAYVGHWVAWLATRRTAGEWMESRTPRT